MITIREVMSTELVTVEPTATVASAATVMGAKHVGSALVLEGERLAGIFTERDIMRALASHFDAAGHSVAEWMSSDPATVEPGADVTEALTRMLEEGFRHLPVMENDRLVGVVSLRDLSRAAGGNSKG
jgi:CBS domain-containing protein